MVRFLDAKFKELNQLMIRGNRKGRAPFGVALDKRYAGRMGACAVIYLPLKKAEPLLPEPEHGGVVAVAMRQAPPIDWSCGRERPIKGGPASERIGLCWSRRGMTPRRCSIISAAGHRAPA